MFIRKDRKREVNEQNQSHGGMEKIREERGFEPANDGIDDDCEEMFSIDLRNSRTLGYTTYLQQE